MGLRAGGGGRAELRGVAHLLRPGQVVYIAPHEHHSARAITARAVLDVFAPPRDDYR